MVAGVAPATMEAAADGGARWGRWTEGEGEKGGVPEDRVLTLSMKPRTARHGEDGRR